MERVWRMLWAPARALRELFQLLGPLVSTLLLFAALFALLDGPFPWLAARLSDSGEVAPIVPRALWGVYLGAAAVVALAYIAAHRERRRAFVRPLVAWLTGDPSHPAGLPLMRMVGLIGLPILVWMALAGEPALALSPSPVLSLPSGPTDEAWEEVPARRIELVTGDRSRPAIPVVYAQSAVAGERVALRLSWRDPGSGERPGPGARCELWVYAFDPREPEPRLLGREPRPEPTVAWRWSASRGSGRVAGPQLEDAEDVEADVRGGVIRMQWTWRAEQLAPESPRAELRTAIAIRAGGDDPAAAFVDAGLCRSLWLRGLRDGVVGVPPRDRGAALSGWWLLAFYLLELAAMTAASSVSAEA